MLETIMKLLLILCMLVTVFFLLGMLFFPKPMTKFLRTHEWIQTIIGIMLGIGIIASFIVVL